MKKQSIRKLIVGSLVVLAVGAIAAVPVISKSNVSSIVKADEISDDCSEGMIGDDANISDDEFITAIVSDAEEKEIKEEVEKMEEEEDKLYEEHLNYVLKLVSDKTGEQYTESDLDKCTEYLNDNFEELINDENVNSDIIYEFSTVWLKNIVTRGSKWIDNYDYEGAAAYADKYGLKYNPKYKKFDGVDCTNFASQCMFEGGKLKQTDTWKPYNGAWNIADGLKKYLSAESRYAQEKRANLTSNTEAYITLYKKLRVGDVVQALDETGKARHSMVIIKLVKGEVYLGAHSNAHNYSNANKRLTLKQFCGYSKNRPYIRVYGMAPKKTK